MRHRLGVLCRESIAPHFDPDEFFQVTRDGLTFFSEFFDFRYPFDKYDQVFVPEFNMGAMENVGLHHVLGADDLPRPADGDSAPEPG